VKRLLTSDEIVARASDAHAVTCSVCKGEGFVSTDTLCWMCSGSGAVLVPRRVLTPKRPVEVTWKTVVGIFIVFVAVLTVLLCSLSVYLSKVSW
jgi:hypothetical protein